MSSLGDLNEDWREFLSLLIAHRVRFVLVGGHALAAHARPRHTEDLDVFVEPTRANAARLRAALVDFGFGSVAPSVAELAERDRVFMLGRKPLRIDVLTGIDGVGFRAAWAGRITTELSAGPVPVIGREALIANKLAAGGPRTWRTSRRSGRWLARSARGQGDAEGDVSRPNRVFLTLNALAAQGVGMSLVAVAKETLEIVERGAYEAPSGRRVELAEALARAVRGTVLYRPETLERLVAMRAAAAVGAGAAPCVEVTPESTAEAARRLVEAEGEARVVALNFASAKNPGGGFLGGAKAQEEDLARCSALYPCQLTQRAYYDANRSERSFLYTDHLIYSPDVPFFRDESLALLEAPFSVSIITAPAPNAGEVLRRKKGAGPAIEAALERRAERVLAAAADHGHRVLVLGAWGCGVFRNDPRVVARVFHGHLFGPRFAGVFDRVVFAVWAPKGPGATFAAFRERF